MPKDKQQVIRLMAPFSMRCSWVASFSLQLVTRQLTSPLPLPSRARYRTCGEYMYKGKKFNARKETVIGEEYYGIKVSSSWSVRSDELAADPFSLQIFRFYIKCITCSSEITFKTDPK
jgi:hypothetical protein